LETPSNNLAFVHEVGLSITTISRSVTQWVRLRKPCGRISIVGRAVCQSPVTQDGATNWQTAWLKLLEAPHGWTSTAFQEVR